MVIWLLREELQAETETEIGMALDQAPQTKYATKLYQQCKTTNHINVPNIDKIRIK
jgi:hypothetical protein